MKNLKKLGLLSLVSILCCFSANAITTREVLDNMRKRVNKILNPKDAPTINFKTIAKNVLSDVQDTLKDSIELIESLTTVKGLEAEKDDLKEMIKEDKQLLDKVTSEIQRKND